METRIKVSEARILVFLEKVKDDLRYADHIFAKLDITPSYCHHILNVMKEKKWLYCKQYSIKKHYFLTPTAPVKEAKKLLSKRLI